MPSEACGPDSFTLSTSHATVAWSREPAGRTVRTQVPISLFGPWGAEGSIAINRALGPAGLDEGFELLVRPRLPASVTVSPAVAGSPRCGPACTKDVAAPDGG
jgi:hypothetical protein